MRAAQIMLGHLLGFDPMDAAIDVRDQHGKGVEPFFHCSSLLVVVTTGVL